MKNCKNPNCSVLVEKNNFCSVSCSNKCRVRTAESKAKTKNKLKNWYDSLTEEEKIVFNKKRTINSHTPEANRKRLESIARKEKIRLLETPWEKLGWDTKRKLIIEEQNNTCFSCGLNSWLGSQIVLEIDHIDGNNNNDTRQNLKGICPNCHSLTETWRGRNKPSFNPINKFRVSDENLLAAIKEKGNIRQGLLAVGLAAKGGNYNRAKKLLEMVRLAGAAPAACRLKDECSTVEL